ncbi:MAG: L-aspartate oxidase [bacterium]|nr:L-aspartate oxidase [bacterium]
METDFLVIGSGIAGLAFAVESAAYGKVTIITKKGRSEANTNYAQGGIAAAIDSNDSIEYHIKDTLNTGAGLCNEKAVRIMVTEAPSIIKRLCELGVDFTKAKNGKLDLGMEGGHSMRRIVHTKDATGAQIENSLLHNTSSEGITLLEDWIAIDLILKDGKCIGVWALDEKNNKIFSIFSKIILIATGGAGSVYLHTTNPSIATGDGISMGYRAGATIANMEFVQFHPTTFYGKKIGERALLLSEAIRGEGGILKTSKGNTFMEKYDARKELACRDIVARAIHFELKNTDTDYVLLDVTHLGEKFVNKFPNIYNSCLSLGLDPLKEPIPVVPAAHYLCGGILTDLDGKTNIPNLYVAGESACTGVHGANRLASNSLLESIVFGFRAAKSAIGEIKKIHLENSTSTSIKNNLNSSICDNNIISEYLSDIRFIMWEKVGIVRNTKDLEDALSKISQYKIEIDALYEKHAISYALVELRNVVNTALLITKCAIMRKESRGLHYVLDYLAKDDILYNRDTVISNNS